MAALAPQEAYFEEVQGWVRAEICTNLIVPGIVLWRIAFSDAPSRAMSASACVALVESKAWGTSADFADSANSA